MAKYIQCTSSPSHNFVSTQAHAYHSMLDLEKDHFGTLNFLELPSSDVLCGSGANTPVAASANDDFQIGRLLRWLERVCVVASHLSSESKICHHFPERKLRLGR